MSQIALSYPLWLTDFYVLSTVLLALALTGSALLAQPAQRHAIAKSLLVALPLLAALCAVPGWSFVHLLTAEEPKPVVAAAREVSQAPSVSIERAQSIDARRPNVDKAQPATTPDHETLAAPKPPRQIHWQTILSIAHLIGAACIATWLALGWFASLRLRRAAQPAPPKVVAILNEVVAAHFGWPDRLRLLAHERIDVAVALGIWRPTILLPLRWCNEFPLPCSEGLGEGSSNDHLRTVLAHEATHVFNRDLEWVAVARLLLIALWANPLYWITRRRLRLDQEALADAAAAEVTSRQQYAEQLVVWARHVPARPAMHFSSAVGLWEGRSQLRERIAILLNEQFTVLRNCSRSWRRGTALVAIGATVLLSLVTTQPASSNGENDHKQPVAAKPNTALDEKDDANGVPTTSSVFLATNSQPGTPNTLEGQCIDENGKPLANVEVVLARVWWQDATRREIVAKQTTPADGRFRLDKVVDVARTYPNGKIPKLPDLAGPYYHVSARETGHVSQNSVTTPNEVALHGSTMNFKMPPAATLRGRVTNPKGEPVAGALVSVGFSQLDRWEGYQTVRSGPDGSYEINDVPPFDLKNVEKTQTWGVGKQDELVFPRVINVEHPNYASQAVYCKKIPGTQDVQLKAAAIITGRVIDGTTRQPVANASVQAFPSRTGNPLLPMTTSYAFLKTDGRGEYRITSLPEGTYDLWAVAPNRVNEGVKKLKTSTEHVTTAPDLVMTSGGTIRVRLIDDKTGKPIPINGDERAQINVTPSPPMNMSAMVEAKKGRFEVQALPGDNQIDGVAASSNDAMKWIIRSGERVPVHVVEGKSTDADVRVQDIANMERFNSISALLSRALDERSVDEHKAIADLEQAIKLDPPYPLNVGVHSCLALILAESADESVRDGKRAVELAQKAQQFEDKPSAFVLEVLAAAYAEVGDFDRAVASETQAIELAKKEDKREPPTEYLKLYESHKPRREPPKQVVPAAGKDQGASAQKSEFRLVQNATPVADRAEPKRPANILGYGDDKPDGKKSYGGSGHLIRFELPEGVTKIKGLRIHGSRYGLPQAPKEDFEITFLSEKRDETLHSETAPYHLFNRGKEQWVRVMFKNEVELPRKFWVALNFNAHQTKGVYVRYDTSTKGQYSRVGLPGDKEEPKETDFHGDWMVQVILSPPKK